MSTNKKPKLSAYALEYQARAVRMALKRSQADCASLSDRLNHARIRHAEQLATWQAERTAELSAAGIEFRRSLDDVTHQRTLERQAAQSKIEHLESEVRELALERQQGHDREEALFTMAQDATAALQCLAQVMRDKA